MKFVMNLIEKIQEIEPMDVIFACMVIVLVVMTAVIAVGGALVILCLVRGIALVAAGVL